MSGKETIELKKLDKTNNMNNNYINGAEVY